MPSFHWFKSLSSKKSKGHVNKYHDYHGYDNLRHQNGPAQYTATPPMMGQQQSHTYHNGGLNISHNSNGGGNQHTNFANQYHQPPPHSLSHRQNQSNPQQIFMQSIPPPSHNHQQQQIQQQQLQPQHFQQQQQPHMIIQNTAAVNQHHQVQQVPIQPVLNTSSLSSLGPSIAHNHIQQQQQQPQQHNHQPAPQQIMQNQPHNHQYQAQCHQCSPAQQSATHMLPLQATASNNSQLLQQSPQAQIVSQAQLLNNSGNSGQVPMISMQQHPPVQPLQPAVIHAHPHMQPHQQLQQPQHCQMQQPTATFQCGSNYANSQMVSYGNLQPQLPMPTPQVAATPQCTCQSCPYQQQLQSHQQQQHIISSPHQFIQQADQSLYSNGCFRHQTPSTDVISNGNNDHLHNHTIQQQQQQHPNTSVTSTNTSSFVCPSHLSQQTSVPMTMSSSTPGLQHHQVPSSQQQQHLQQQQQHHQHQQIQTNMTVNMQQYQHYHTIQPTMYQQQKQQLQHHRGHSQLAQAIGAQHESLKQQHVIYQAYLGPQSFSLEQQQRHEEQQRRQEEEEEAKQDFQRYANMPPNGSSCTPKTDFSQASKYQEHVYCNQKPELPPYEPPPTYEQFIAKRGMYAIESVQHTTHLSESMLQRTKDSSYENLRDRSRYQTYQEGFTS